LWIAVSKNDRDSSVSITLDGGNELTAEIVLYAIGRNGSTDSLGLDNIDVKMDQRGNIVARNKFGQTDTPSVYAAGDVLVYASELNAIAPTLASTAAKEGRLACLHALDRVNGASADTFDIASCIFTIPEIAFVGSSAEELLQNKIPFVVGMGRYEATAKGEIIREHNGFLKIIVEQHSPHRVLGVHIIGPQATELIYSGQMLVRHGMGLDTVVDDVFPTPTLHVIYQVAAFQAKNILDQNK